MLRVAGGWQPVSGMGLECHLQPGRPQCDFLVRISSDRGEKPLLDPNKTPSLFPLSERTGEWNHVAAFFSQWNTPGSLAAAAVKNIWLEYDIAEGMSSSPCPSLFFDVPGAGLFRSLVNAGALLDQLLPSSPGRTGPLVEALLNSRYPINVHYVGLMLQRGAGAVRVCLSGLNKDTLFPFWRSLGKELSQTDEEFLAPFIADADKLVLDIDVYDTVHDGFGIEIGFSEQAGYTKLLEQLTTAGLCEAATAQALTALPLEAPIGDEALKTCLSQLEQRETENVQTYINHIKIARSSGGEYKAKAYLYLSYC